MFSRREFLQDGILVGAAGATMCLPWAAGAARRRQAKTPLDPTTLTKYLDPLPIPGQILPSGIVQGVPTYHVRMTQFKQQLHSQLPPTTVWGYNGTYPGPTFNVQRGQPIAVEWTNHLPAAHMFPIDYTLNGAGPTDPAVRTVVHLHGAKVLPDSDGHPDAWFTSGFGTTGKAFANTVYTYPNDQAATMLWYHDHTVGITRLNVCTGLQGMYFIRDAVEVSLDLPKGAYEVPLLLQDRMFCTDGSLLYPVIDTGGDPDPNVPPVWIPEFFGDTILVNGKVWPYLEVEPRKYRFRMLNGANARLFHLTLNHADAHGVSTGKSGPKFIQIGTDGGLLPAPLHLKDLLIAPAERYDVVIDFSGMEGKSFVLNNDANAPYPGGDAPIPGLTTEVMLFKVTKRLNSSVDDQPLPAHLVPIAPIRPKDAIRQRDLVLSEDDSAMGNPIVGKLDGLRWNDPPPSPTRAGSIEQWNLINITTDAHPIHVHLVEFQVLNRQALLTDALGNPLPQVDPSAPLLPPDPNERPAWKDTVKTYPGYVTRIIAKFDLPAGTKTRPGQTFRYMWHCHILEHEDNEMMRPYDVIV